MLVHQRVAPKFTVLTLKTHKIWVETHLPSPKIRQGQPGDVQGEAKVGNPDALAGAFAAEQAHGVSYDPNIATLIRETDD